MKTESATDSKNICVQVICVLTEFKGIFRIRDYCRSMVQGKKTYYSIEYFSMPSLSLQNIYMYFYGNQIIALLLLCDKKVCFYKDVWFKGCHFLTISRINLNSDVKTKDQYL